MADGSPYYFHKIWDTPQIQKQKEKVISSPDYRVEGLIYRFHIFRPGAANQEGYVFGVSLLNPPFGVHPVKLTIKLLGKKQKQVSDGVFSFSSENKTYASMNNQISIADMSKIFNKGKLAVDVVIKYEGSSAKATQLVDYRSLTGHVGLQNHAATCYMNSILEMLFYIPAFRKLIYSIPKQEKSIPLSLQQLFCLMQLSPTSPSTNDLIHSFGWTDSDAFVQNDVQEFLRVLIANLEGKLDKTELKGQLQSLLSGQTVQRITCVNCDYSSETSDTFYDLSLVVKGKKNIDESLAEMTADELLNGDNQYEIEKGHKEDAVRGTKIKKLPPVLNLHLTRFEFSMKSPTGMEKVRDYYEFPSTLDMGPYTVDQTKMEYELITVLSHIGGSFGGHYIAFCKNDGKWFKFNDEIVECVKEEEAINGNFGGEKSQVHAYYLCYVRKSDSNWVMNEKFDIPAYLMDYYEAQREVLDPSKTAIIIVNRDNKKVLMNKTDKVSQILHSIDGAKELWKADENGFPVELLPNKATLGEVFNKRGKVFAADFESGSIQTPRVFSISFFVRQRARIIPLGLMPFSAFGNIQVLSKAVTTIIKVPITTELQCYTEEGVAVKDLSSCDPHLIFQAADLSAPFPETEPEKLEGLVRIRDLLPEIVLDTVPRYMNHMKRCIHVKVLGISPEITIELPDIMPFKILVKCIRQNFKIPETDGVGIYLQENGDIINFMGVTRLREALDIKEQFTRFMEVKVYAKIFTGMTQERVDERLPMKFPIFNEEIEQIKEFSGEVDGSQTVGEFLEKIAKEQLPEPQDLRIVVINHSRIERIVANSEKVGTLRGHNIRVEIIPEGQKDSAKLLPVAFSVDPRMPFTACFLTPFLISVEEEEPFELTACRIMSVISGDIGEPAYVVYKGNVVGTRLYTMRENDNLYDYVQAKDAELFIILPRKVILDMYAKAQNRDVKILN